MTRCPQCKEQKDESLFRKNRSKANGICSWCKDCNNNYDRARHHRDKEKYIPTRRKYYTNNKDMYRGTTFKGYWPGSTWQTALAYYLIMREEFFHKCAVCGRHEGEFKKGLTVDHDHNTLKVRGLLCPSCNGAEGLLRGDIGVIKSLISYLEAV